MNTPEPIANSARERLRQASEDIRKSLGHIDRGEPLRAEPEAGRAIDRVALSAGVTRETARKIVDYQDPSTMGLSKESEKKAEALQGVTVDYLGVAWLDAARVASRAVGRIIFRNGGAQGTGFLVSDRLVLTNNHVIASKRDAGQFVIEFNYETGSDGRPTDTQQFEFNPDAFFQTDDSDDLDFTLIALGRPLSPTADPRPFGCCPLSDSPAKHSVGEPVNIVQHPDGDFKQVVIRENRILHRGETVLHYVADTEPGASGSPVFNDDWHVVALHHWGEPHREVSADGRVLNRDVNEGIRVSAIVAELKGRETGMTAAERAMLTDALKAPRQNEFGTRSVRLNPAPGPQAILGSPPSSPPPPTTFSAAAEAGGVPASRIDRDYDNRRGYNPRFLTGFEVPLPALTAAQRAVAARVRGVGDSANPFELKYEHFSVVQNGSPDRRMPFYSVVNIDGAKRIQLRRSDLKVLSGPESAEGAEAGGETWTTDPRIPESAQLDDAFYDRMRNTMRLDKRRGEFLARGHMTRREDPSWGAADAATARKANDDTYHHPNACPQAQNGFNGSQKFWQGIENYVLDAADDANLRVTVITGPVFDDRDPVLTDSEFGTIRLPRRFWKIVARVEDGTPIVFAVLADQTALVDQLMRISGGRSEAADFDWPDNLSVEFKTTVAHIAELTGLDFGDLATHDAFAGADGPERITRPDDVLPGGRRRDGLGFGTFATIESFLEAWEARGRKVAAEGKESGKRQRKRLIVDVEATVSRLFADDLSGSKHQQFAVVPTKWLAGDAPGKSVITDAIDAAEPARVAVRFGDARGLPDRIPGVRTGVEMHLKGEWIPADEAYAVAGVRMAVLHFTHDPLGFVCVGERCYS